MTVAAVLRDVFTHPWRHLVRRWNWKSAALSASLRGGIFFWAALTAGPSAAIRAVAVDTAFRVPMVGFHGAVTQGIAEAKPRWAAIAVVAVVVPAFSHAVEFAAHSAAGTVGRRAGIEVSILVSLLSGVFQLFAVRHGALRVGPTGAGFFDDLRRLPGLILAFATTDPRTWLRDQPPS